MLDRIIHLSLSFVAATAVTIVFFITQCRQTFQKNREESIATLKTLNSNKKDSKDNNSEDDPFIIGFFHPNCSAGGGGERVLWKAIQALGEVKEGKMLSSSKKRRDKRSSVSVSDVMGNLDEACLRNCRNLTVVVYTVDEPSANYKAGEFLRHK